MSTYYLQRITDIARDRGISIRNLSLKAGLSVNTVRTMIQRNSGKVNNVMAVASVLGVPLNKLYQGEDAMAYEGGKDLERSIGAIKEVVEEAKRSGVISPRNESARVPLISLDMVTSNIKDLIENRPEDLHEYYLPLVAGASYMLIMPGRAMEPDLMPGDVLVLQYMDEPRYIEYGRIYLLETVQGFIVRRLEKSLNEDALSCVSPAFGQFDIARKDILSYSLVLGKLRLE